ncbi:hypothetical protein [Microvirga makkahensis]|uniref:Uncharacterized protein n=1 Tax=Microvirga makkahensis TaxID=1128670 RepID=A0A7X3SNU3_9HYPH|nr:hypothetical protein [Microvirga makkahensis]MXQ11766.1 hypothetical protein [Microvirga makkahensis]
MSDDDIRRGYGPPLHVNFGKCQIAAVISLSRRGFEPPYRFRQPARNERIIGQDRPDLIQGTALAPAEIAVQNKESEFDEIIRGRLGHRTGATALLKARKPDDAVHVASGRGGAQQAFGFLDIGIFDTPRLMKSRKLNGRVHVKHGGRSSEQ